MKNETGAKVVDTEMRSDGVRMYLQWNVSLVHVLISLPRVGGSRVMLPGCIYYYASAWQSTYCAGICFRLYVCLYACLSFVWLSASKVSRVFRMSHVVQHHPWSSCSRPSLSLSLSVPLPLSLSLPVSLPPSPPSLPACLPPMVMQLDFEKWISDGRIALPETNLAWD